MQSAVEVAERIVGDAGQVDDGVDAGQVVDGDVADVAAAGDDGSSAIGPDGAVGEQVAVEADDLWPAFCSSGTMTDADVAVVSGDENSHDYSQTFQGGSPDSHKDSSSFLSRTVSMHCQKPSCR